MKKCAGCSRGLPTPKRKWCSIACRSKNYKRKTETGICEECGGSYEYATYRKGRTRFCSNKCVGTFTARKVNAPRIAKRVELVCMHCGIRYKKPPYQAKRSSYCGKICQGKQMSITNKGENNSQYVDGRKTYRKDALDYYGNQCKLCSKDEDVQVHHIDGIRSNNNMDNLLPVCGACHRLVHNIAKKATRFATFVEDCFSMDYYNSFILPLVNMSLNRRKAKKEAKEGKK